MKSKNSLFISLVISLLASSCSSKEPRQVVVDSSKEQTITEIPEETDVIKNGYQGKVKSVKQFYAVVKDNILEKGNIFQCVTYDEKGMKTEEYIGPYFQSDTIRTW